MAASACNASGRHHYRVVAELDRVGVDGVATITVERDGQQRRVRLREIDLRS